MALRTVTQGEIVAAMLRSIAGQLIKLAGTLEEESGAARVAKKEKPRTPAQWRDYIMRSRDEHL